jgi:uncharacterized protein YqeY
MPKNKNKNFISDLLNPPPARDPSHVLDSAQKKAKKIIIKATIKAKDIIESADALDELLQNELNEALSFAIQRQSEMFGEKIRESAASSLAKFEELLEIQLKASQTLILSSFEKSLGMVNESLKAYEAAKRNQIDEVVRLEAKNLAREIVGNMMPENLQEKLINEAIEKAKKEGVFE